jgi:phosphinothricin acetyltransferase
MLPQMGFHTVTGRISLPNPASLALHRRMGFEQVGHFPEVGFKFGRWVDVVDVQRRVEVP